MDVIQKNKQTNLFWLALTSVLVSVAFSFLGAPFLRAFSVSAKPKVFWTAGVLLVIALIVMGMTLPSVYIGAIWMTLGIYSELEKRGVNWRAAGLISLISGVVSAAVLLTLLTRFLAGQNLISDLLQPLQTAMNKAFPEDPIEASVIASYLPGIFAATLFMAMGLGFILETKINQIFNIQRTRVASGLKWLEFRLPDAFIWVSLFAAFFGLIGINQPIVEKVALNIVIVSVVAFFFQGLVVVEFMTRAFRLGSFSKTILFIFLLLQAAPALILVGLIDYWADFRQKVRKKIKAN
ncbi:MAG: DUF2232 domain-containing protein [Bdellovibrio sp.]|nr:DUF2232 domain-containing protein [Bdellovibrio sp.]